MVNKSMYELGAKPNKIRELFEFGKARAKVVGPENVFDYTLGNPSIPAPAIVNETAIRFLQEMDSKQLHGYTSNIGDEPARAAIAADLDQRFGCGAKASEIFITCGAAPALTAILRALAVENG